MITFPLKLIIFMSNVVILSEQNGEPKPTKIRNLPFEDVSI